MKIELLKKLVNEQVSLEQVLKKVNPSAHYQNRKPCFCPFHDNTNTPAAVFYDDDDGQKIWCYAEQRMYTASDAIEILSGMNVYEVGSEIWESMSELEQEQWLQEHNDIDALSRAFSINKVIDKDEELTRIIDDFKMGRKGINELLKKYSELYKGVYKK